MSTLLFLIIIDVRGKIHFDPNIIISENPTKSRKGILDIFIYLPNIFNILMVLGIAATISPITFLTENIIDIIVLVIFSGLVWAFAWTKKQLDKKEGIIMLVLYVIYTVYILMR